MLGEYDAGYENCIDAMVRQMEDMQFRIDCLHADNAHLRELVDELYPLADYGAMDASELDRAHDLMRELGIEVGG